LITLSFVYLGFGPHLCGANSKICANARDGKEARCTGYEYAPKLTPHEHL
jgi:hypothetical protein